MKKILYTVALTLMLSMPATAQIFMLEDSDSERVDAEGGLIIVNPDYHGSGEDWYTPLGGGTLLLAGLGGAYLLGKKRKK